MMPAVICVILVGISGSGKSRHAAALADQSYVVVSPDELRKRFLGDINDQSRNAEIHLRADVLAGLHLSLGNNVVLDATNTNWWLLLQRIGRIRRYSALSVDMQIHFFDVPLGVAAKRIAADLRVGKKRADVPLRVLARQHEQFEQLFSMLDWNQYVERICKVEET